MGFEAIHFPPPPPAAKKPPTLADLQTAMANKQAAAQMNMPGYNAAAQTNFEKDAGVTPPGFQGMVDPVTGQILDQYKVNPFAGEASQRLRTEALGTGPSEWAKIALGKQGAEESQARGIAGLQQQQAQSQAMSNLSQFGGVNTGARTSLARSGARDLLMAKQNVAQQGLMNRYGINQTDAERRQQLLGTTADVERQGDLANLQTSKDSLGAKAQFDTNRYNQQMQAWAAKQSADAQRAAAAASRGGGKGK